MILIILLGLLGAILGSFANMLIYRLPRGKNIFLPSSYCPTCKHTLSFWSLIPIFSYIFQLGKCRYCEKPISIRYFLTEIFSMIIIICTWLTYGNSLMFFKTSLFLFCMLLLFFIDLETMLLPDIITLPLIGVGLIFSYFQNQITDSFQGILAGFFSYLLVAILAKIYYKQDALGGGDIKLGAAIGAFWGLKLTLVTIYFSFILGGLIGLMLVLLKIKKSKDQIPFAPYIIIAFIIALIWGNSIWNFYFGKGVVVNYGTDYSWQKYLPFNMRNIINIPQQLPMKKGYLLLELAIAIVILSLLIISPMLFFPKVIDKVTCQQISYETYHTLNLARNFAVAVNEDVIIEADNNVLNVLYNETLYKKIKAPEYISFTINGNKKAGFKGSGHAKYARTIKIQSKYQTKELSISIANGKISMGLL